METETIHRVQAFVDGELPAADQALVEALIQEDPELKQLHEELTQGREWLRGNEPERSVPEPRDFYWSKIATGIERAEHQEAQMEDAAHRSGVEQSFWLRWLLPMGSVAAVLVLAMLAQFEGPKTPGANEQKAASYHEVDNPLETGSLITFRSNTEGVTVVWITSD